MSAESMAKLLAEARVHLPSVEHQHRMEAAPAARPAPRAKLLPIHGRRPARLRHKTPASLYTHVIAVLGDGIRRTGSNRIRERWTRDQMKAVRPDLLAASRNEQIADLLRGVS
jgi:hypothetical protein